MENRFCVMYIDDLAPDRMLFREMLKSIDKFIKYVPAKSGQDGLDYLNDKELQLPDYIFLDVIMPGMDGIECLQKIKKIKRAKHIPLYMYTISKPQSIKETIKLLGAVDCIQKKIQVEKSTLAIAKALNKVIGK